MPITRSRFFLVVVSERFYEALNELMQKLRYTVVACAIRKDEHLSRYGVAALDPYLLSLDVLVGALLF